MTEMIVENGRPAIVHNGKKLSYAMYSDPIANGYTPEQWIARNRDFAGADIHIYTLQPYFLEGGWGNCRFWTDDGVYPDCSPDDDIFCVDRQARGVIAEDPDAKLFVRFGDFFPNTWQKANPDHLQTGGPDPVKMRQPSLASEKALRDLCIFIEKLVSYCYARDWGNRIIGYLYYPIGEGIILLNSSGYYFDQSKVMQEAFKKWVMGRYETEDRLRKAWKEDGISFDSVKVPADQEWNVLREKMENFSMAEELQKYRDYACLQRELFLHWHRQVVRAFRNAMGSDGVLGLDAAKQPMMGWELRLAFGGIAPGHEYINFFATSGSLDVGELLDEPGLDILVTPADYTARTVGYGWESEGLSDSLKLRGKTILVENDIRTFVPGRSEQDTLGAFLTLKELQAGIIRHTAWALTRGHMDYWMTLGAEYFHDPVIMKDGITPAKQILDRAPHIPHLETGHAIAMIIDDTSPLYEDGSCGFQNLAVLWQRIKGLAHCGIPYRIYLFSDLLRENMPDYRCYYFPNLYKLDEERFNCLKRKVFRDGRMAVFGPATGITDGSTISAEWASRLLGVEMEVVHKKSPRHVCIQGTHPVARNLPSGMIYGDSYPYGPILVPAFEVRQRSDVHVLGTATTFFELNRPGLILKDFDGAYSVAWSIAVPMPPEVLRELARYGGCHVWCEQNDVIFACGNMASIHCVKDGTRTVKLPEPSDVWDMVSGERLGRNLGEITVQINPPETRLFYLGESIPGR